MPGPDVNKPKSKLEELKKDFRKGKDYANEQKQKAESKGFNIYTVTIMVLFGAFALMISIVLYGADLEEGFTMSAMFDPFKIFISIVMLILGLIGYVLLASLGSLSAQETKEFVKAITDRNKEVEKIKDKDEFHKYRLNTNHKNKVNQWLSLIDLKLSEKYRFKKLIEVVFKTRKKWERLDEQTKAYIKLYSEENLTEDQQEELLKTIHHFNMENAKVGYKEWRESFFLSSDSNVSYSEHKTPDTNKIVKDLATRKTRVKVMVWAFSTITGSLSISAVSYDLSNVIAVIVQLMFIVYASVSGWKDGWHTMLTIGIAFIKEHTEFVMKYLRAEPQILADKNAAEQAAKEAKDKKDKYDKWLNSREDKCKTCGKLGNICDGRDINTQYTEECNDWGDKLFQEICDHDYVVDENDVSTLVCKKCNSKIGRV